MNPPDAMGLKVEIKNSVFRRNWMRMGEGEAGGGSLRLGAGDVRIDGCRFYDGRAGINNFVNASGAAICLPADYAGTCRIADCVFGSNATTFGRGGGIYAGRDAMIERRIFSGNSVERGSGGGAAPALNIVGRAGKRALISRAAANCAPRRCGPRGRHTLF